MLQFVSDSSGIVVSFVGLLVRSYAQPINVLVIFPRFPLPPPAPPCVGAVARKAPSANINISVQQHHPEDRLILAQAEQRGSPQRYRNKYIPVLVGASVMSKAHHPQVVEKEEAFHSHVFKDQTVCETEIGKGLLFKKKGETLVHLQKIKAY